jgi:hypothetical protein
MEHLPIDTLTGKVKGTSSNTGTLPKPIDFSDVEVYGTVPRGGTSGQALVKNSNNDFDTLWTDFVTGESGIEPLINGQNYIDVAFTAEKPSADWILNECHIVNEIDASPLNLAPGIITSKTTLGFRLQLNGAPNSNNYELHWAIGIVGPGGGGGGGGGGGPGFINVLDHGAKADCVTLFDITMPNGNVVTSAGHTFVAADVGKWAIIRGATDPSGNTPLIAQITAVSGNTATLSLATTTALTNIYSDSFPRMDFGTDNTAAFTIACWAIPGPGNRNHYDGTPFAAAGQMNPILPGDGGTVYIPRGNYLMIPGYPGIPGLTFWFIETNNITLKGDGMGQTVLFQTSDTRCSMPLFGGFVTEHGLFQNWIISDLTFYDLNYYNGGGNSLDIRGANNVRIERVEICNSRGNGGINYQGYNPSGGVPVTNRLTIKDCWVHGIIEDGYSPSFPRSIEGDGMNVGQVRDVHIENNTIERPGRHAYEGGGNCADQYFIGNTIDMGNGGDSGINPTGGSTTVVMGNTIKNVAAGWYGIDFTVDSGTTFVANNIRVVGNYVHGNMQAAFRFQNTSGDPSVSHVDRIIIANNWVQPDTNASTVGVLVGGSSSVAQSFQMLIVGNWFNNLGKGFTTVEGLAAATGKWVVIRNNVFASSDGVAADDTSGAANLIVENNTMLGGANSIYGGKGTSCNIDGQPVAPGAIYSNAVTGLGWRTTDQVEIVRGASMAPQLIVWGVITNVVPGPAATGTLTTYAYNPTAGTLNTGGVTKFIVHRPLP